MKFKNLRKIIREEVRFLVENGKVLHMKDFRKKDNKATHGLTNPITFLRKIDTNISSRWNSSEMITMKSYLERKLPNDVEKIDDLFSQAGLLEDERLDMELGKLDRNEEAQWNSRFIELMSDFEDLISKLK